MNKKQFEELVRQQQDMISNLLSIIKQMQANKPLPGNSDPAKPGPYLPSPWTVEPSKTCPPSPWEMHPMQPPFLLTPYVTYSTTL